jgi:hypothetical protein
MVDSCTKLLISIRKHYFCVVSVVTFSFFLSFWQYWGLNSELLQVFYHLSHTLNSFALDIFQIGSFIFAPGRPGL